MRVYIYLIFVVTLLQISCGFDLHKSLKRSNLNTGPLVNFSQHPYVALILAGGQNNTILTACTGSILNTKNNNIDGHNATWILTSTFCILNREDPANSSADLLYKVLIFNPNGDTPLNNNRYSTFDPQLRILHPQAGTIKNYSVEVTTPPGPTVNLVNISVNVNDVGLIRLPTLVDIPGVTNIRIEPSDALIPPGSPVKLVGYGFPDVLNLHATNRLETVLAFNTSGRQPDDQLFFHDTISKQATTTALTEHQGVEVSDEGGPILNAAGAQVAIGQATWRVSPDNSTVLTFASLGPLISYHRKYIVDTLALFAEPNAPPPDLGQNGTETPSGSIRVVSNLFFMLLLPLYLW